MVLSEHEPGHVHNEWLLFIAHQIITTPGKCKQTKNSTIENKTHTHTPPIEPWHSNANGINNWNCQERSSTSDNFGY